ncbi:hypothetical protein [Gibbsiella dentisursi]
MIWLLHHTVISLYFNLYNGVNATARGPVGAEQRAAREHGGKVRRR